MITICDVENDDSCMEFGELGVLGISSYQLLREETVGVVVSFSDGKLFRKFIERPDDYRKNVIDTIRRGFSKNVGVLILPPGMSVKQHLSEGGRYQ